MIKVEIVTPQGKALVKEVKSVNIPTWKGEMGVLEKHMYLMTLLKPGLVYFDGNMSNGIAVTYGYVDVSPERVIILAEEAYAIGEIDVGKEKEDFDRAIRQMASAKTLQEIQEWEKIREKSRVLIELVEKFGGT